MHLGCVSLGTRDVQVKSPWVHGWGVGPVIALHMLKAIHPRGYVQGSVGHKEAMFNSTQRDQERLHGGDDASVKYAE